MYKITFGTFTGLEIGSNGYMMAQSVTEADGCQKVMVTDVVLWISMLCDDMVTVKIPISRADLDYSQGVLTEEMLAALTEDDTRRLIEYHDKPTVSDGCLIRVTPYGYI